MKKLLRFGLLVSILIPVQVTAQSAFNGTWKFSVNTAQWPQKPDEYLLKDGNYQCKTCVPPVQVKADGQDHSVSENPYADSVSITIVDDHTITETDKKNGKVVTNAKTTVSPDGKTALIEYSDSSATSGAPVTGKQEQTRVAKGPDGSHAISGSWRTTKFENVSENALFLTYKVEGDSLSMSNQTGQSYTAKLDGTEAPYHGDPGTTSVSVKLLGKDTIEETDKRDGKIIVVSRVTVAPDGKTLNFTFEDKLRGTTSSFVATKQ